MAFMANAILLQRQQQRRRRRHLLLFPCSTNIPLSGYADNETQNQPLRSKDASSA